MAESATFTVEGSRTLDRSSTHDFAEFDNGVLLELFGSTPNVTDPHFIDVGQRIKLAALSALSLPE